MAAPQLTLTATLTDVFGNIDAGAKLRITLAGFAGIVPKVNGSNMLSRASITLLQPPIGQIVTQIFGNDVITPVGSTFYCIEVLDSKGNIVQSGNYQINGSGSVDLSNIAQFFPPPPPTPGASVVLTNPPGQDLQTIVGSITIVGNLIVTGTINGGGTLFNVAFSPTPIFNGNLGGAFRMVLTGPVTSSTGINMANKTLVPFQIVQDGIGGHTFVWPATFRNPGMVNPGPNARTTQIFMPQADGSMDAASSPMYS